MGILIENFSGRRINERRFRGRKIRVKKIKGHRGAVASFDWAS